MKKRFLIPAAGLLLLAALLSSCTQSAEQNPIIQEKFQKIIDLAEDVDQLRGKMKDIENDIDTINQDLTTLKQMPRSAGVSSTELESMKATIKQQEAEIAKLTSAVSSMKKEISSAQKAAISQSSTRKSSSSGSSKVSSSKPTPRPTPEPTPRKRGKYYEVQSDDTIASIARKFNTTESAVRSENHIPDGKQPLPGTRLYIIPGN